MLAAASGFCLCRGAGSPFTKCQLHSPLGAWTMRALSPKPTSFFQVSLDVHLVLDVDIVAGLVPCRVRLPLGVALRVRTVLEGWAKARRQARRKARRAKAEASGRTRTRDKEAVANPDVEVMCQYCHRKVTAGETAGSWRRRQGPVCLGARYESLMHADLYPVASSPFRVGLFLPSYTNFVL